ncbi:tyrosine--tRNA ligase [Candidatus Endobugula sertula]|uniref:Tyrosine--tRNA ligase n=1 Tax=Candidatus Endobugula sertula TaxID=62101 RepID=A0A1D2QSV4_9GAMM|nr:tyrosine--tRNA ligase [Candidatus Endobugula sertula]
MAVMGLELIEDLQARGLIAQMTGEDRLASYLSEKSRTLYCGFDPTADSLHIGSLVPLLTLKRFQNAGHKPIALVGGATGLIGDPSFKAQERKLNTPDVVAGWVDKLKSQVSKFISFDCGDSSAEVVNNLDWVGNIHLLDFLRNIGKHFSVNNMIQKESVKQRLDREGEGISFTEFTYTLLQSYDFAELYKRYGCSLQIGGSDQWGNIVGGTDLTRRLHVAQVFGLTLPLVTKADGTKFGKTESGTIWLDPAKTSPYAFYQFWINTADADVYKFLRYFTFLDIAEIEAIEEADHEVQSKPQAQRILAEEVTKLVHGEESLEAAQRITEALFSGGINHLSYSDMEQLQQDGLPSTSLADVNLSKESLSSLFVSSGLAKNGKQVRDVLSRNAVLVNGKDIGWDSNMQSKQVFSPENARFDKFFVVKLGKKNYHLFFLPSASDAIPEEI